jgi:hypothetical protein
MIPQPKRPTARTGNRFTSRNAPRTSSASATKTASWEWRWLLSPFGRDQARVGEHEFSGIGVVDLNVCGAGPTAVHWEVILRVSLGSLE